MKEKTEDRLIRLIDKKRGKIIKFTQELIRIPSVNSPPTGEEKECQAFIAKRLKKIGMKVDVFSPEEVRGIEKHPFYNPGRLYKGRPNVVGTLKGNGGRSLLLTGHADVVSPGQKKKWKYNPWEAKIVNGRIYGCGAADTKGGLAAQIMAIESIRESGISLQGDVCFASVVDEEFGGVNGSLSCVLRGYKADAGILAEPTRLNIQPGTAGGQQYKIIVKGKTAFEGEKHKGVSAIEKMYKVIETLGRLENVRNKRLKKHTLFSGYPIPAPIVVIAIHGGDSNVGGVPDRCWIEVWHGALPGETEKGVLDELHQWLVGCSKEDPWLKKNPPKIEPLIKWIHPCEIPVTHPIVKTVNSSVKKVTGIKSTFSGMRGACDLSLFTLCGNIPTLVLGPGNSSLAHTPNEFVPVEEVIMATKIIALTILDWCKIS